MEGSEEFSADHRSLENEMGSWDLPFLSSLYFALLCFGAATLALTNRPMTVLEETDTERTNVHMPYRMKPMIQRRFTLLYTFFAN